MSTQQSVIFQPAIIVVLPDMTVVVEMSYKTSDGNLTVAGRR